MKISNTNQPDLVRDTKRYSKSPAVKQLEAMVFERKQLKHPNIPINLLSRELFKDNTANALTKCIIMFIKLRNGQAERISTTGRCIDRTERYTDAVGIVRTMGSVEWIPGTSTNGSADISATIKDKNGIGRSVKIEVKIKRDVQSESQKK